jgi:hypothetical protein
VRPTTIFGVLSKIVYVSGLSAETKAWAAALLSLATIAQLSGVILVVLGIRDDRASAERVKRIPIREPRGVALAYPGAGPSGRESLRARFYQGQAQLFRQEFSQLLKGSRTRRRLGVGLLLAGIVLGFAGSMVALVG